MENKEVSKKSGLESIFRKQMERMGNEIAKLLPQTIPPERMMRIILTATKKRPLLLKAVQDDNASFWSAVLTAAAMGLEPEVNGEGFLMPLLNYKTGKYYAEFWPGYPGYLKLMYNAGYDDITGEIVRENDFFKFSLGTNKSIEHTYDLKAVKEAGGRGAMIGAYIVAEMKGVKSFRVFDMHRLELRREDAKKRLKSGFQSSPWGDKSPWLPDMYLKTALTSFRKFAKVSASPMLEIEDKGDHMQPVNVTPGFVDAAMLTAAQSKADIELAYKQLQDEEKEPSVPEIKEPESPKDKEEKKKSRRYTRRQSKKATDAEFKDVKKTAVPEDNPENDTKYESEFFEYPEVGESITVNGVQGYVVMSVSDKEIIAHLMAGNKIKDIVSIPLEEFQ